MPARRRLIAGTMTAPNPAHSFGERKLAAIMAGDVVGYSRLVALDEVGTLAKFKTHVEGVIRPQIARERGRLVKTMGDGVLAEFASVVDCVRCAVAIQEQMAVLNAPEEFDRRMDLRIGINAGEILVDSGDIYGDAVIVACRLQATADAGGISLSDAAVSQIKDRRQFDLEPRGEVQLKNIPQAVRVWRISGMAGVSPPAASLAMPDKPCIAVLPFAVMGVSDDHDALADGLTEDIITALSRIHNLFVIARSSTFTYKGRAIDIKQVARELGVQYVLEGSVRETSGRLRISAQLIDASSGVHVWAEKYDRARSDVFELQDEITRNVAASVQTQVSIAEGDRWSRIPPRDHRITDHLNIAIREIYRVNRHGFVSARVALDKARAIDPDNAWGFQIEAVVIWHEAYLGLAENPAANYQHALAAGRRAIELDQTNEYAHWIYGLSLSSFHRYDEAADSLRRAIEINPNCSVAFGSLGTVLMWGGDPEESIRNSEIALRSNPRDPANFFRYFNLAGAYLQLERYADAVRWARQAAQRRPDWAYGQIFLAASLAHLGQVQDAAAAYAAADELAGGRLAQVIEGMPFRRQEDRARVLAGMEKARIGRDIQDEPVAGEKRGKSI